MTLSSRSTPASFPPLHLSFAALLLSTSCAGPTPHTAARSDVGTALDADVSLDAGSNMDASSNVDAGSHDANASDSGSNDGGPQDGGDRTCVEATLLWFDDFETAGYTRWTGSTYGDDWSNGLCHSNGFSQDHAISQSSSHRSEITCATPNVNHRGYGGVQFTPSGTISPQFTNQGVGVTAPHGLVITFSNWLDVPYSFGGGRWFSPFTVNSDCAWQEEVITLGIDNAQNELVPAHITNSGGTVTRLPSAIPFPLGAWARVTLYLNYTEGEMHGWLNGRALFHATFSRPTTDICQLHFGLYASGANDDIVLYEEDMSVWRLEEPWTDFGKEPWFDATQPVCP